MNVLNLPFNKQQGFTLLESLVALAIFSIVVLGSGMVMSRMLNIQQHMYVDDIIVNEMQSRLQQRMLMPDQTAVCADPRLTQNIELNQRIYYVACGREQIQIGETDSVQWPVLAVSDNAAHAQACASGIQHASCYVVGR